MSPNDLSPPESEGRTVRTHAHHERVTGGAQWFSQREHTYVATLQCRAVLWRRAALLHSTLYCTVLTAMHEGLGGEAVAPTVAGGDHIRYAARLHSTAQHSTACGTRTTQRSAALAHEGHARTYMRHSGGPWAPSLQTAGATLPPALLACLPACLSASTCLSVSLSVCPISCLSRHLPA